MSQTATKTIGAKPREEFGKNAARRIRRQGQVPAVLYGGGGAPISLEVDPKGIVQILHSEAGRNALFTLEMKGKAPARVMLRDWLVDPVKGNLLHVDMVRVAKDAVLTVDVPIHLVGEPKGVKVQGGILEFVTRELEVECLPDNIPDHITVDVTELTLGRNLRVSELPVDASKVKVLTDPARVVAHVVALKVVEEKPAEEVAAEAAPAEPEVIKKGKAEEEAEEGAEKSEKKPEKKPEKAEKKEGKK